MDRAGTGQGRRFRDLPFAVAPRRRGALSLAKWLRQYSGTSRLTGFRENGTDIYPVYGAIGRQGNPCDGQHGGNAGSYDRGFGWWCLQAPDRANESMPGTRIPPSWEEPSRSRSPPVEPAPIVAISLGTVVGSEDDEGVFGSQLVQGFHELASVIDLRDAFRGAGECRRPRTPCTVP